MYCSRFVHQRVAFLGQIAAPVGRAMSPRSAGLESRHSRRSPVVDRRAPHRDLLSSLSARRRPRPFWECTTSPCTRARYHTLPGNGRRAVLCGPRPPGASAASADRFRVAPGPGLRQKNSTTNRRHSPRKSSSYPVEQFGEVSLRLIFFRLNARGCEPSQIALAAL